MSWRIPWCRGLVVGLAVAASLATSRAEAWFQLAVDAPWDLQPEEPQSWEAVVRTRVGALPEGAVSRLRIHAPGVRLASDEGVVPADPGAGEPSWIERDVLVGCAPTTVCADRVAFTLTAEGERANQGVVTAILLVDPPDPSTALLPGPTTIELTLTTPDDSDIEDD